MNIVRRPIGRNDAGLPEDRVCDIVVPLILKPGAVLRCDRTGDMFDNVGKKSNQIRKNDRST
jgi:hypothetical protein